MGLIHMQKFVRQIAVPTFHKQIMIHQKLSHIFLNLQKKKKKV